MNCGLYRFRPGGRRAKAPDESPLQGRANVMFSNGRAILYKIAQRLGIYRAVGPLIQEGLPRRFTTSPEAVACGNYRKLALVAAVPRQTDVVRTRLTHWLNGRSVLD